MAAAFVKNTGRLVSSPADSELESVPTAGRFGAPTPQEVVA